jgi:hypothetical protein
MIQYAVGLAEKEDLPVTTTAPWQRRRHFWIAKCIGAQLLAAVGTVPLGAACGHLGHADTFEVEPFFVALEVSVNADGRTGWRGELTLLSHEII